MFKLNGELFCHFSDTAATVRKWFKNKSDLFKNSVNVNFNEFYAKADLKPILSFRAMIQF